MQRLIHWQEIESYARSPFAEEKAQQVIDAAVGSGDFGDPAFDADDLIREHEQMNYRLVPVELLENIIHTMKESARQYHEMMEQAAPLIVEASQRDDGNRFANARRLLDQAMADAGVVELSTRPPQIPLICPTCGKTFPNAPTVLAMHQKTEHGN